MIDYILKGDRAIKHLLKGVALMGLFICGFSQLSQASLSQGVDENLTIDSATSLIWLDVDFTTNISWNQMQTMLAVGGAFQNFRLATTAEINTLYTDAGLGSTDIASVDYFENNSLQPALSAFLSLTGQTPNSNTSTDILAQRGYNLLDSSNVLRGGL